MDANLLYREEVYEIVNCAMEVINTMGHGLNEKPCKNALVVEFNQRDIPHEQQKQFPVIDKGVEVAKYIPDLIAYDAVIVDAKTIERITDHERGQMLNFKHSKLEWQRLVLTQAPS